MINHVGLTVADIRDGVSFYEEVFGLRVLQGPTWADRSVPGVERRLDVFGERWHQMWIAHLVGSNGAGLEIYEFVDPPIKKPETRFEYWRLGPSHLAFAVSDIERTIVEVERRGGVRRTQTHPLANGCMACYCEDPWENAIELNTGSYESAHPSFDCAGTDFTTS